MVFAHASPVNSFKFSLRLDSPKNIENISLNNSYGENKTLMRSRILIINDSRGKGAHDILNSDETVDFDIVVRPGATLRAASAIIAQKQSEKVYALTIVNVGICNLTKRKKVRGIFQITYTTTEAEREVKIADIKHTINLIRARSITPVIFCTIIPACLEKCNQATSKKDHAEQQKALTEDTNEINAYIKENNTSANVQTIDICRFVKTHSLKRKRTGDTTNQTRKHQFSYKHLEDGVHYDDTLKRKSFIYIGKVAIATATNNENDPHNTSQDSIDTIPDWDFKRHRTSLQD